MVTVLILLAASALCWGTYTIACEVSQCPDGKASRALIGANRLWSVKPKALWEGFLGQTAKRLSRWIRLDGIRREKIASALSMAGEACTPEEYLARAFAGGLAVLVCGIPISAAKPMIFPVSLTLAAAVGVYLYYSIFDAVKKRRSIIEAEIPRFTLSLSQHLKNDRDVLRILTAYRKVAGAEFGAELDKTIAAMRSGSFEDALLRLAARVGSSMLSEVVRGLIGTIRGDDQTIYFEMLSHDMRKVEQNRLEKEAQRQPGKIRKYSMLMLLCIVLIYAVVLCTEMIGSLGAIF